MEKAGPPVKLIEETDTRDLRGYYEVLALGMLRLLWRRRRLIAASMAAALALATIVLVHMGPRYTVEALIQPNLAGGGLAATTKKGATLVSVSAADAVNSTERIIRSRAIADAVVRHLWLDEDPRFNRRSFLARCVSAIRSTLGLQPTAVAPHALAVDAVMHAVRIVAKERSYVISVAATAADPRTAAMLANAFAAEYIRLEKLQDLVAARSAAESHLAAVAAVYGRRLPNYEQERAVVAQLRHSIASLRHAPIAKIIADGEDNGLLPAGDMMQPSGPNVVAILGAAMVLGFGVGAGLARYNVTVALPRDWVGFRWMRLAGSCVGEAMKVTQRLARQARFPRGWLPVCSLGVRLAGRYLSRGTRMMERLIREVGGRIAASLERIVG